MKNSIRTESRSGNTEELTSDREDRIMETTQSEDQKETQKREQFKETQRQNQTY